MAKVKIKLKEIELNESLVKRMEAKGYPVDKAISMFFQHTFEDMLDDIKKHEEKMKEYKKFICKKCGGIPVHSFVSSMMAKCYGKECTCDINENKKKKRK